MANTEDGDIEIIAGSAPVRAWSEGGGNQRSTFTVNVQGVVFIFVPIFVVIFVSDEDRDKDRDDDVFGL